jgi:hypothetical protein
MYLSIHINWSDKDGPRFAVVVDGTLDTSTMDSPKTFSHMSEAFDYGKARMIEGLQAAGIHHLVPSIEEI